MPATSIALILRDGKEITDEKWLLLVEARRQNLRGHLRHMPLQKIGDLRSPRGLGSPHAIKGDKPFVASTGNLSLATQGIFWESYDRLRFWGLTRRAKWIVVEALGYQGKVTRVSIQEVSLPEMVAKTKTTLGQAWSMLSSAVEDWVERRQELLEEAKEVARQIGQEDYAVRVREGAAF